LVDRAIDLALRIGGDDIPLPRLEVVETPEVAPPNEPVAVLVGGCRGHLREPGFVTDIDADQRRIRCMHDSPGAIDDEDEALVADVDGGHDRCGVALRLPDAGFYSVERIGLEEFGLALGRLQSLEPAGLQPLLGNIAQCRSRQDIGDSACGNEGCQQQR
jgi:hypothetical protein